MEFQVCRKCGEKFLVKRDFCPRCFSTDIGTSPIKYGKAIESVRLIAGPEGFPDEYFVVYVSCDGVGVFCRSDTYIPPGSEVSVSDDNLGPVCTIRA